MTRHRTHPRVSVRARVISDVIDELARQDAKWGQQNHPSLDPLLLNRPGGCTPQRMAAEYEIPTAIRARSSTDRAAETGHKTWGHVLVKEVAEVVDAGVVDGEPALRSELIQAAAVALQWAEAIDRRSAQPGDGR